MLQNFAWRSIFEKFSIVNVSFKVAKMCSKLCIKHYAMRNLKYKQLSTHKNVHLVNQLQVLSETLFLIINHGLLGDITCTAHVNGYLTLYLYSLSFQLHITTDCFIGFQNARNNWSNTIIVQMRKLKSRDANTCQSFYSGRAGIQMQVLSFQVQCLRHVLC